MKKWLFMILLAGFVAFLFSPVMERKQQEIPLREDSATVSWNKNNYPVHIVNMDSKGAPDDQIYEKPPQKVIAVWQNSIETLLALGVGDRIVAGMGVPDKKYISPQYQDAYEAIPYKKLENLDVETVRMMDPDLIVGWYSTFATKVLRSTEFWKNRGIHSYIAFNSCSLYNTRTVENEYTDILNMGRIFDRKERAESIVQKMRDNIAHAKAIAEEKGHKPRALIIELQGPNVMVYGKKSLAGDILQKMNGELLASDEIAISKEQIIELNPDAIFLVIVESDYDHPEDKLNLLYEDKALQNVPCIKERKVQILPLYSIYASGTRTLEGIQRIGKGLYPEWEDLQ